MPEGVRWIFTFDEVQIAAHAPDNCSPWMLGRLNDLAQKHGLRRTVHLSQSTLEVRQVRAMADATSAEYLHANGWLGDDLVAAHWVDDPTRRAVWLAMRSTAATRSLAAEHSRALVTTLLPMIKQLTEGQPFEEQVTICEVVVEMAQSLLHFSVSDGKPNPDTVRELKRMLRAYLRAVSRIA